MRKPLSDNASAIRMKLFFSNLYEKNIYKRRINGCKYLESVSILDLFEKKDQQRDGISNETDNEQRHYVESLN